MARPARIGAALPLLAATIAASCSQLTDQQPFPGACAPFAVVAWQPAGLSENVPTNSTVSLTFSDYPDPDTVGGDDLILTSGVYGTAGVYHVDLLTRSIDYLPTYQMLPNLTYQVTVYSALHSLQGCPVRQEVRTFSTGAGATAVTPAPPTPTLAAVLPIFAQSCGGSACHRQSADAGGGCLAAPAEALSLCDTDAYGALINVGARELGTLALVKPYDSSRSYLLRKLLSASPDGPPVPTTLGHRDPPGAALDDTQLRTIADWIDGGALLQ